MSPLREKSASYLHEERSALGTWNYWEKSAPERETKRYPDDLDDTSVALLALSRTSPQHVDPALMAAFVHALIAGEYKEGGPYETWIVPDELRRTWHDIDPAVNANIFSFLSQSGIKQLKLETYLDTVIRTKAYISKYYHRTLFVMALIARSYRGKEMTLLREHILETQSSNSAWENTLENALGICAYLWLGGDKKDIERAIDDLSTNDDFLPHPFFIEERSSESIRYSGSVGWTAATVICAIDLLLSEASPSPSLLSTPRERDQVYEIAHARLTKSDPGSIPLFASLTAAVFEEDTRHEVSLLPLFFARSLRHPPPEETTLLLSAANLLGWIGYTMADDALDGEGAIGNETFSDLLIGETIALYSHATPASYKELVADIFASMPRAAKEEAQMTTCERDGTRILLPETIPEYGDFSLLAEKSFGHALGPIILLAIAGGSQSDINALHTFFRSYLIARQLNDDAHDWIEDLEHARLNAASSIMLKCAQKEGRAIPLAWDKGIINEWKVFFWETCIDVVSDRIETEVERAEMALADMAFLSDKTYLFSLIAPLAASSKEARHTRDETRVFIQALAS